MSAIVAMPKESASVVVLADVSGSMRGTKIRRLKDELNRLWPEVKARLMAFSDQADWLAGPDALPEPCGGTDLAWALDKAAEVWPSEVVVISDGLPMNEEAALAAAERVPGVISVCFIGDDEDHRGAAFMRRLAAVGGGTMVHKDLAKGMSIGTELRSMLALAPPIAL